MPLDPDVATWVSSTSSGRLSQPNIFNTISIAILRDPAAFLSSFTRSSPIAATASPRPLQRLEHLHKPVRWISNLSSHRQERKLLTVYTQLPQPRSPPQRPHGAETRHRQSIASPYTARRPLPTLVQKNNNTRQVSLIPVLPLADTRRKRRQRPSQYRPLLSSSPPRHSSAGQITVEDLERAHRSEASPSQFGSHSLRRPLPCRDKSRRACGQLRLFASRKGRRNTNSHHHRHGR